VSGRALLLEVYRAALDRVHGGRAVERALAADDPGPGPFFALGAGKASCAMAAGARAALGERLRGGEVVTKPGHAFAVPGIVAHEASHPLPDARSVAAGERALARMAALDRALTPLVLLSGGASALWLAPAEGISLEAKRAVTEDLLRAGADIGALNCVRKHLSRIKGGGLARAGGGRRMLALAVSDVPGDEPHWIGSGPVSADPTSFADALGAIARAGVRAPPAVRARLEAGAAGRLPETAKPGEPALAGVDFRIVATLDDALAAAEASARRRGLRVRPLSRRLGGEARECACALAREARGCAGDALLLTGGEPVVHVRGSGVGGRAQEAALAFALEIDGLVGVSALFAGTDGSDGPTEAAGACVDGSTVARARELGLDPRAALDRNDSHALLAAVDALVVTGPTQTNVTDLALILVSAGAAIG
jgi:glycerate 2-kinase